ncbi:WSC domain-containing protein [Pochonia chlamydosporia 170]|uniref:WSC domain-containing protein n=1 Tax=Pochonia chlamydosporia 170 TaxID=1380566 RepID=A0A179EY46_METCM|nr:WSC domain-containing protein [Pochonia chlamydosporia 170]OAQ57930.1 WSC domain-containing protein [Pochonia chlamydosporia 170]
MSSGSCNDACKAGGYWVSGLHATKCLCGYAYPPDIDVVDDKNCNYPCLYYDLEACGGVNSPGYWSVFNLGVNVDAVAYEKPPTTSSQLPKPTSTNASMQLSSSNNPVNESQVPTKLPDSAKANTPNTASIVAGVIVGVVGASAVLGGIFLLRRKRNAEHEKRRHRPAVSNDHIGSSSSLGASGINGITSKPDARLDPAMAHRRVSDGSIDDSKDYSHKILRVMNP